MTEPAQPAKRKTATRPRAKKETAPKVDATESARGLIEMVELFTQAKFGEQGRFNLTERALIEPALGRILERYASVMDQFSGFTDPLLLLGGLGMFAIRLRAATVDQAAPVEQPAPVTDQAGQAELPGLDDNRQVIPSADPLIANMLGSRLS